MQRTDVPIPCGNLNWNLPEELQEMLYKCAFAAESNPALRQAMEHIHILFSAVHDTAKLRDIYLQHVRLCYDQKCAPVTLDQYIAELHKWCERELAIIEGLILCQGSA